MGKISGIVNKLARLVWKFNFQTKKPQWFWLGFAMGVIYFGYGLFWMWSAYPLNFLAPMFWLWKILLIFFPFALTTLGFACFWGGFLWLIQKIKNNRHAYFIPFLAGGLFAVIEYLRSYFLGILWWGSGSLFGPHWTFGNPAYLFSGLRPIYKTLSVWGIYGLDFWVVLTATTLLLFLLLRRKIFLAELAIALAIIPALNLIQKEELNKSTPRIPVSIIQTKYLTKLFPETEETLDHFRQELIMLKEAAKNMAEKDGIIIFAEGADFSKSLSFFLDPVSVKNFFTGLSKKELLIIDSDKLQESDNSKLKTIFINSKKGVIGSYDKTLLMPGTEFLPYLIKWPLFALKQKLAIYREFAKGDGSNILRYGNLWAKILICSDTLSPNLARKGNFDFIIVQNGFGVLGGSRQLANQMMAMAKARAVENSKDLIFASNFGRSYLINSSGKVIKMADDTGYEMLTGEIVPLTGQTWYNKFGDWPVLVLSFLLILSAILKNFWSRSQKTNAD